MRRCKRSTLELKAAGPAQKGSSAARCEGLRKFIPHSAFKTANGRRYPAHGVREAARAARRVSAGQV